MGLPHTISGPMVQTPHSIPAYMNTKPTPSCSHYGQKAHNSHPVPTEVLAFTPLSWTVWRCLHGSQSSGCASQPLVVHPDLFTCIGLQYLPPPREHQLLETSFFILKGIGVGSVSPSINYEGFYFINQSLGFSFMLRDTNIWVFSLWRGSRDSHCGQRTPASVQTEQPLCLSFAILYGIQIPAWDWDRHDTGLTGVRTSLGKKVLSQDTTRCLK